MKFPIDNPRALLDKSKRELDRLVSEANGIYGEPDETSIADLTINVAWSLWHVTDWIGSNRDPKVAAVVPDAFKQVAGRRRLQKFQKQLRRESKDLKICWALALHFKHFELDPDSPAIGVYDNVFASDGPAKGHDDDALAAGVVDEEVVARKSAFRAPAYSNAVCVRIAVPSVSTLHPKVVVNGEKHRLTDVYARAYDYLDALLTKYGL